MKWLFLLCPRTVSHQHGSFPPVLYTKFWPSPVAEELNPATTY